MHVLHGERIWPWDNCLSGWFIFFVGDGWSAVWMVQRAALLLGKGALLLKKNGVGTHDELGD